MTALAAPRLCRAGLLPVGVDTRAWPARLLEIYAHDAGWDTRDAASAAATARTPAAKADPRRRIAWANVSSCLVSEELTTDLENKYQLQGFSL